MSVFKRGKVYWYEFVFNGERIRKSTHQRNRRAAEDIESAHRTALAKGEAGIFEKKKAPTLAEFKEQIVAHWKVKHTAKATKLLWSPSAVLFLAANRGNDRQAVMIQGHAPILSLNDCSLKTVSTTAWSP